MMDHRDFLLCAATEERLTKEWLSANYPIAVGLSWYHGGVAQFCDVHQGFSKYFCFDAHKFDSAINPWMVDAAISICRYQFEDGEDERYDAYWNFVKEGLLDTPIFRDDGRCFQKHVGTTSGHPHNTLIQSIITLICAYAGLILMKPDTPVGEVLTSARAHALGDDNLTGVMEALADIDAGELAQMVYDAYRIDWRGSKSFETRGLFDVPGYNFNGVQYLGKYFRLEQIEDMPLGQAVAIPYRPTLETILRLYYPEYGGELREEAWLRAAGNYLDAAGNRVTEAWLQRYMDWLEEGIDRLPEEWPANYEKMVSRDYEGVGTQVPRPQRMSYEKWRDLVLYDRATFRKLWKKEKDVGV